jgi:hypothetical protein
MQVEGCVYWGLLEAFIGANVLQESRLARIFLLPGEIVQMAGMYVCFAMHPLMCSYVCLFCSIRHVSFVNSVADKA